MAISRCGLLITGKYSTFSAWGAYLGNVLTIFSDLDYGRILPDTRREIRLGDAVEVPKSFLKLFKETLR